MRARIRVMKNEKRRVLIGEIMDNETKKIRPIGFFPKEDERNFECAGAAAATLAVKACKENQTIIRLVCGEAFNEEELREIIDSAYDAPKGIFEMLGKTWEDSIYINPCFYFGPAEECTVSIRVTAERIAAGLVMLPIGEGLVFCPKGRGPVGAVVYNSGIDDVNVIQFGQLPINADIHAEHNKVVFAPSKIDGISVPKGIIIKAVSEFLRKAYGEELMLVLPNAE